MFAMQIVPFGMNIPPYQLIGGVSQVGRLASSVMMPSEINKSMILYIHPQMQRRNLEAPT